MNIMESGYRAILMAIALVLMSILPSNAASIQRDLLTEPLDIVRERLIIRGIAAYQAGYYTESRNLLRDFLSRRRLISTPLEKKGLIYLALAYQQVGDSIQASETINRAISLTNQLPLELAYLEDTAGTIAQQQHQIHLAIAHWQKARYLYLASHDLPKWAEITLKIAQNQLKLGNVELYQDLVAELELNQFAVH